VPIHPTAIIDPRAELDPTVDIGPYVVIEGPVRLGPRTRVMAGAFLAGRTEVGADNVIHPHAVIGHEPQDLSYRGEDTGVRIGDRNTFREHTEVHRGTREGTFTEIGNDNYLMSHVHIAHNCRVADRVIMATGAMLGGHVHVEERVVISGNCAVHQFCRVGRLAMMRGLAATTRDIPPFVISDDMHIVRGLNRVGLRRAGLDRERIAALARAVRILFRTRTNLSLAMARVEAEERTEDVQYLLEFIRASQRGVAMGPARGAAEDDDRDGEE
jgi:UDP-N-acetylglucosamine acyltransferase